jgi:hypothetical protein
MGILSHPDPFALGPPFPSLPSTPKAAGLLIRWAHDYYSHWGQCTCTPVVHLQAASSLIAFGRQGRRGKGNKKCSRNGTQLQSLHNFVSRVKYYYYYYFLVSVCEPGASSALVCTLTLLVSSTIKHRRVASGGKGQR